MRFISTFKHLIVLFFAVLSINNYSIGDEIRVKVLTYNIHHGSGIDGVLSIERIARVIKESGAQVVALQEVDRSTKRVNGVDTIAQLSQLTGMAFIFGSNLEFQGGNYGNAILSSFPIVRHKSFHFEQLGPGEQRGVIHASIELGVKKHIQIWNTHLDHRRPPEERLHSLNQLVLFLKESSQDINQSALLVGDLNSKPTDSAYGFANQKWSDSWDLLHGKSNDSGYTYPANKPNKRIDYHFILQGEQSLTPVSARIIQTEASDHLPLLIEYQLN